jgi:hypothetical protein
MAFEIERGLSFIVYGAGILGRIIQANLLGQGMRVACFLDRRAGVINAVEGTPVYAPEDPALSSELKAQPVIVAISDYFAHEVLAQMLFSNGFSQLIFKKDIIGGEHLHAVNALYDRLFDGVDVSGTCLELPVPQAAWAIANDQAFLHEQQGEVTAYLPMSLLFRSPERAWRYSPERHVLRDTSPEPAVHWTPHDYPFYLQDTLCRLFEAMQLGRDLNMAPTAQRNLSLKARVFAVDESVAGETAVRYVNHFQQMTRAMSVDPAFFVRHPAQVKWHEDGYFFILDGNTRLAFLFARGLTHAPCRMSADDYQHWVNQPAVSEVAAYLGAHKLAQVPTPIPHASFYHLPAMGESVRRTVLESVFEFLAERGQDFSGMRIADLRAGIGHFAQGFSRGGANVTALEPDAILFGLLQRLNTLLRCPDMLSMAVDWRDTVLPRHDCVLLIDCVSPGGALSEDDIRRLDNLTADCLFYEVGSLGEAEEVLARSSFDTYRVLCESVRFGAVRYLVVFTRDETQDWTKES